MGIRIRPEEIEKRLSRIFADQTILDAVLWMVDDQLSNYTNKLGAPIVSDYHDAFQKFLRNNGAIEAVTGLRKRIEYYSKSADKETLLDQTD